MIDDTVQLLEINVPYFGLRAEEMSGADNERQSHESRENPRNL